jgi:hypothetical protein
LPKGAAALVREAVRRSTANGGAALSESMTNTNGQAIVLGTGRVNFREKAVQMQNASGDQPPAYPAYETRFVDGWNYVPIDPSIARPLALRARARWVAIRYGYSHGLPIPGVLNPPELVLEDLDAFLTEPLIAARFAGSATAHTSRVQFQLSRLGGFPSKGVKGVWTVSITSRGIIDGITYTAHNRSQIRFRLSYLDSTPKIEPPAAHEVQRLAPDENLYPTPTTVCCSSA